MKTAHQFYNATTMIPVDKGDPIRKKLTAPLCRITSPEEKRQIIGDTFITISQTIIASLDLKPDQVFLGQGTLRPDLIESASKIASSNADAIKTHHNDTELVRQLRDSGRVVEPLKDFHKDEVRQLGRNLGLPADLVQRHPFPGPGLAVRVICADEAFMEKDFSETACLVKVLLNYSTQLLKVRCPRSSMVFCVRYLHRFSLSLVLCLPRQQKHALLNRIEGATNEQDREFLKTFSDKFKFTPTLLPIKSVGVQVRLICLSRIMFVSSH